MDLSCERSGGGKPAMSFLLSRVAAGGDRPTRTSNWFVNLGLIALAALAVSLPEVRAEVGSPSSPIVPLRGVAAGVVAPEEIRALCGRLPSPCRVDDVRVYTEGKAKDGDLWLIDAAKPSLVKWDRVGGKAEQWDFSAYSHSWAAGDEGGEASPLILHPALYPGIREGFSVALVREQREMYSGGGASFGVADFVAAGPGGRVGQVLYAAVPFTCQKMIRACFSERDYRTSRHCHDESSGYLTIDTPVGADWQFTWHETEWPANTRARDSVKSKTRFTVPRSIAPGGGVLPEGTFFCGGPT